MALSTIDSTGLTPGGVAQSSFSTNVAGNGPAFSAYQSSAQSISGSTLTKVQLQTKEFDTNNNFDATTNYRFTPTVAGYYQVSCSAQLIGSVAVETIAAIFKNGSAFKYVGDSINSSSRSTGGSTLVFLNGSTDYVEFYFYTSTAGALTANNVTTWFQASMVRSA